MEKQSFITELHAVQKALEAERGFGRTASIADPILDIGTMIFATDAEDLLKSDSEQRMHYAIECLEETSREATVEYFVSDDGRKVRLLTFVPMASARTFMEQSDRALNMIQKQMGPLVHVEASGYLPFMAR